jgi:hypothetical protein
MQKEKLTGSLIDTYNEFIALIHTLKENEFLESKDSKWTPGQHLDHLVLSVKPLVRILRYPKFYLKFLFGRANRPSRTFDELINRYQTKLESGGVAPTNFIPAKIEFAAREKLITDLKTVVGKLTSQINSFTERDLDYYILPHPLLGKLTLREMIYFTIYHAMHHGKLVKRDVML